MTKSEKMTESFPDKFAEKTLSYDEHKDIPTKITDEETLTMKTKLFLKKKHFRMMTAIMIMMKKR